jgi:HlyD family secretion protein
MKSRLLFVLLLLAGCARGDGKGIRASGQVEATEVRVATKVPGNLERVAVEEGDAVTKGSVLAVLDTVDLALVRSQNAADRDQARANLALLQAGSRKEDVAGGRAVVAQRKADFDAADKELTRQQALLEKGLGAEKAVDDARGRRDMAKAALDAANESLARLVKGSRPEEIAGARAAYTRAQAKLAASEEQVTDGVIRSPLDGVVTAKLAESGEYVNAGTGVVVVSDVVHPWLTVFVGGEDLPKIKVGSTATVYTDAKGDKGREGRVSYVSPTAEFTPRNVQTREDRERLVYAIEVRIPNPDLRLREGMPVEVAIEGP